MALFDFDFVQNLLDMDMRPHRSLSANHLKSLGKYWQQNQNS